MRKKLIKTVTAKNGTVIEEETMVDITFPKDKDGMLFRMTDENGNSISGFSSRINNYFKIRIPSMNTVYKMSENGIAKSVAGHNVEPDGWDHEGTPSWLLVMGVI